MRLRPTVKLPAPAELQAVLTAIREARLQEAGVTHLRLGGLEIRIAAAAPVQPAHQAPSVGALLVDEIIRTTPEIVRVPPQRPTPGIGQDVEIRGPEDALAALVAHRGAAETPDTAQ